MLSNTWTGARRAACKVLVPLLALPLMAGVPAVVMPAQAFADDATQSASASVSVRGTDTLNWGDSSFECATVSGLGGSTLYADVVVGNKTVTKDMTYSYDKASDTFGVVQLNAKASYVASRSGDITLNFYGDKSSKREDGAKPLLSAKVYAVCIQVDGQPIGGSVADSMIGIRTAREGEEVLAFSAPTQIVRDGITYALVDSGKVTLKDGVLYVSYEKASSSTTEGTTGSVVFVDENGKELKPDGGTYTYTIPAGGQKTVDVPTSITANGKVYTPLSAATQLTLTETAPEQRVYCVARAEADKTTQEVTLNYVSTDGATLMVDRVIVGAGGFYYAPATSFSQANDTAVSRYTLKSATDSLGNEYSSKDAADLKLTRDGAQVYTLVYEPEQTELTYTVNFALVSAGDNGNTNVNVYDSKSAKVTSTESASIALPATIEKDGKTYKRSGSDDSLAYTWSDLSAGRLLTDTVYYVSDDVKTPAAYDVEVRYVDAVTGNQIGSKTLTCKPDGSALSITSPESVSYEGTEYARLGGQSAAITHRFYAPYRTYTVYYAVPGSMANGNTTITRTVVVDGGIRYYTINSDGTVSATGTTGGLVATTPYTATVSQNAGTANADGTAADSSSSTQTGDATAPSGDTAYEERISDEKTPLSSGKESTSSMPSAALVAAGTVAAAFLIALALLFLRRKRNGSDDLNNVKGA